MAGPLHRRGFEPPTPWSRSDITTVVLVARKSLVLRFLLSARGWCKCCKTNQRNANIHSTAHSNPVQIQYSPVRNHDLLRRQKSERLHGKQRFGMTGEQVRAQLRHTTTQTQKHYEKDDLANLRVFCQCCHARFDNAVRKRARPWAPGEVALAGS